MFGAADLLSIMQTEGAAQNPPTIQLAVMTSHNTLMIGEDLELSEEQTYYFERDTFRMQRTHRPPKKVLLDPPISIGATEAVTISEVTLVSDSSVKEYDNSVYVKPYQEGDTVAVICIGSGQYLVLGKVITGAEVKELDEMVDHDWELEGNYDESTANI